MERFHSPPFLLELLQRQLQREWEYLENGQLDLAIFYFKRIHTTYQRLRSLSYQTTSALERQLQECDRLNERILQRLEEESRALTKEIFETGVDRQIHSFLREKERKQEEE